MYAFDYANCKQFTEQYKKEFLLEENEQCRLLENKNKKKRGYQHERGKINCIETNSK